MNIEYTLNQRDDNTVGIRFANPGLTKHIPDYYNQLSVRQANIVLEEYSNTDGSRHNREGELSYDNDDNVTHYQLGSNVKETIDRLHHLAIVSGHKTNLCFGHKDGYNLMHYLSIRLNVTETRADRIANKEYYVGKVFCFETANHTLVARRNGKVMITGNSNEAEWRTFRNNKNNEAFIDRVYLIKVPYCVRITEEKMIFEKLIRDSKLADAPCAPPPPKC